MASAEHGRASVDRQAQLAIKQSAIALGLTPPDGGPCSCENGAAHMRGVSRGAKRREQVIAGALAPAALFGGETAVLMVMRVTLALRGARATRGEACLKRRELRVRVRIGLAAEDAPGVNARVRAIEAEPDAASQRFNIGLAQARVGADRARRRARGALVDARRERGDVGDQWTPMRSEDLFDAHVLSFGSMLVLQSIAARVAEAESASRHLEIPRAREPSCSVWRVTGLRGGLPADQRGSVGVVHDRA
ncbi:MAG TPA: hypothetical protein VFX51_17525 [Solirubrobacteraceae bacterium]|nr:hypothetical protein [Solirubrobacteraceae bacterium]